MGTKPISCDICGCDITKSFIDGATRMGPWAILCTPCHKTHGVGLGTGRGQKYKLEGKNFVKTEG